MCKGTKTPGPGPAGNRQRTRSDNEDLWAHGRGSHNAARDVIVSITHLSQFARSRDLRLCLACETLKLDVFLQLPGNFLHLPRSIFLRKAAFRVRCQFCNIPSALTRPPCKTQSVRGAKASGRPSFPTCPKLRHVPPCMSLRNPLAVAGVRNWGKWSHVADFGCNLQLFSVHEAHCRSACAELSNLWLSSGRSPDTAFFTCQPGAYAGAAKSAGAW